MGRTLLAEGARGSLTKEAKRIFNLDRDSQPQVYGLGIKELWDVEPAKHQLGRVIHTQGFPLKEEVGGGFVYHQANSQVALGFVVGLGYRNPHLSPFHEFQRWKQHPLLRALLEGGRRVSYGARVINEGGWQAVPRLAFPGGALVGCAAGFVNVPRIKGTHTAMKSGMIAAEQAVAALAAGRGGDTLDGYAKADVRIGFGPVDRRWEVAVVAKNLTDKITAGYRQSITGTNGSILALPDPPRTVAFQFTIKR